MRLRLRALLVVLGWLGASPAPSALAQEAVLPEVRVSADADEELLDDVAASASRIDAGQMRAQQVRNIKDAVRYEPGVSVSNKASRFGLSGFNIRGLEDNRVLMQIDGIRMPDTFKIGGYSSAGRDMADVAMLSGIDIFRGTGSARHGADALGGVVSYSTPSPEDVLRGRRYGGGLEVGVQRSDESLARVGTLAADGGPLRMLVRVVRRDAHETRSMGEVRGTGIHRTVANPQDARTDATLFKLAFVDSADYRAELTHEDFDRGVHTNVLSSITGLGTDTHTFDDYSRARWSLDQHFSATRLGDVKLKLFQQTSRTHQYTRQDFRTTAPAQTALIERIFELRQRHDGARLEGRYAPAAARHWVHWGVEYTRTRTEQTRDGYSTRANGVVTRRVSFEDFPVRDFSPSEVRQWAVYAQDEVLLSENWSVLGSLRYDDHRLKPRPDQIYLSNPAAATPTTTHFTRLTPVLAAVWRFAPGYSGSVRYSHGFRPPPYDDVNTGFGNQGMYIVISNPALRPETSRGVELSLRRQDAASDWTLTAFDNFYRDFIETAQLDCPADPACDPTYFMTYQAVNVPRVRIRGVEGRLAYRFADNWVLHGSFAYARGRDQDSGKPVATVNPLSGALGLAYERGDWLLAVDVSGAARKRASDARESNRQFLPGGYGVVDVRLRWRFLPGGWLSVGVSNLFDRLYYHWADVPIADVHEPDSRAGPERYSQPGRKVAVSFGYEF